VIDDCVPLAMFIFGVALALLIRRVELPQASERLVPSTVALLGTFTGVFFVAYIAWSVFGGPSNYEYFFPEAPWLGVVYLILLALIPSLVLRSGYLARRNQPRRRRNHIEIVGSMNELA
jgi:purine-cytosine permease-like protein